MSNQALLHPVTGAISFGRVPMMRSGAFYLEAGEIHLRQGKHFGPNRGFGAAHIWEEHRMEMAQQGLFTRQDVPAYVALIVRAGTPLHFAADTWKKPRLLAIRAAMGMAVLEQVDLGGAVVWSVVTAYSANKKGGPRVGAVL